MCLIVVPNKDVVLTKQAFTHFSDSNQDGFGMMYLDKGYVRVFKIPVSNNVKKIYKMYEKVKDHLPIMHFRMRTHGDINQEMAHPYNCGYGIWMMHNGVMGGVQGTDTTKSDTWYFVHDYINPLLGEVKNPAKFILSVAFYNIMAEMASGQRMVFMGPLGHAIINEDMWHTTKKEPLKGLLVSNNYAWDFDRAPVGKHQNNKWWKNDTNYKNWSDDFWKQHGSTVAPPQPQKPERQQLTIVPPEKITVYPAQPIPSRENSSEYLRWWRQSMGIPVPNK